MVTTEQIKDLRDKTGVSVMQCKKALEEAGGDMEKALVILQTKSKDIASKKSDRTFGAGVVASYVHASQTMGALVELVCETDFVSKNDEFKALARDIAMHITAANPAFLKATDITDAEKVAEAKDRILLDQNFVKNPDITISGLVDSAIQKFGEKIEIARFVRFGVLEK
ncbi:elongation factor Ts [Patescibacteria group bacterium]|nr:elongation factor Ts [Patescibacteria group bacterium]